MYSANLIGKQMDTEFGLYLPEYSIPAPEVQTNYKEIPFRDGAIDKTSPDGVVHYKDREWDLTFKKTGATVSASDLASLAMSVMNAIHGKAGEIIFDDDPNYKWVGRVFVTSVDCENNGLLIVNIHMITHPYKYSLADIVVVDEIQTTSDEYEGSIVSLTGGIGKSITELLVPFSPIQDLHGYDHPWPAGGGVNLLDIDGYLTDRSASYTKNGDTYTITAAASLFADPYIFSDTDEQVTISFGSFANGTTTNVRIDVINTNGTVVKTINPNSGTKPVTANKIRFNWSNQGNFTISKLQIEKGSTATAWTPYSNICPISGRTGLSVYDDPKYGGTVAWNQLFPALNELSASRCTVSATENLATMTVNATGITDGRMTLSKSTGISSPVGGHKYLFRFAVNPSVALTRVRVSYGNSIGIDLTETFSANSWRSVEKLLTNSTTLGVYVQIDVYGTFASGNTVQCKDVQIIDLTAMFGSTIADYIYSLEQADAGAGVAWFRNLFPKDYYPYDNSYTETCVSAVNGDPYWKTSIDWTSEAGTVYGGTLDVVTGVLTVDRAMVDLGDFTWELWPGYTSVFRTAIPSGCKLVTNNTVPDWLSSIYKVVKGADIATNNATIGMLHQTYLTAHNDSYADAATFKTAMNGVQLVYELATPLTYQLTPTQVAVLTGTNNVWSTGDSVSVTISTMDKVTLVNHGKPMNPKINVVSEGSISLLFEIDGTRYTAALSAGEYTLPDLVLFDGSTDVYEAGEGTITYTYPEVSL